MPPNSIAGLTRLILVCRLQDPSDLLLISGIIILLVAQVRNLGIFLFSSLFITHPGQRQTLLALSSKCSQNLSPPVASIANSFIQANRMFCPGCTIGSSIMIS